MSSKGKGARLYLRPARKIKGKPIPARWVIRDGTSEISTGLSSRDREEAERKLAEYITSKHAPERRERPLSEVPISDVVNIYLDGGSPVVRLTKTTT
jgi:hypothetical protein